MRLPAPYEVHPNLRERRDNYISLWIHDDPDVAAWRLFAHRILGDAWSGATPLCQLMDVQKGGFFRSRTIVRKGVGRVDESTRGQARVIFDLDDYRPNGSLPAEEEWLFLRMQQQRVSTGTWLEVDPDGAGGNDPYPHLGPVYCVPPAAFLGALEPAFTLAADAPADTSLVSGEPVHVDETEVVPRPLHLVLARPATVITIMAGPQDVLISLGIRQTTQLLPAGKDLALFSGQIKDVVIASGAAGVVAPFTIQGVMAMGR